MTSFTAFIGDAASRSFAQGEFIFRQNEPANGMMYVLLEGEVVVSRGADILEIVDTAGGVFGEFGLVDELPRSADALARVAVKVAVITGERFRELTLRNPSFALEMMRLLARRARANLD